MSDTIEENGTNRKCSESSDSEYDPQYKPIISLPEVIVSTNEEDEVELVKIRAKLYRWSAQSDPPEWKERGTGDIKILRNKINNNCRIVMRRDKTLKVCANHFIVPWLELSPKSGSDKAFVYTVIADFADEQAKQETLAVKFGTVENATLFKNKFEEAREIVKTECTLYNGEGQEESDDDSEDEKALTEKLSHLEVSKDENSVDLKN